MLKVFWREAVADFAGFVNVERTMMMALFLSIDLRCAT